MSLGLSSILLTARIFKAAPLKKTFAEPIVGRPTVIDCDTREIHGGLIRLQGVDAPEGKQLRRDGDCQLNRCGQQVANALAERIGLGFLRAERYRRV